MTVAQKLKELREKKGLSQADCAKAIGIDRTTYAKYENGGSVKRNVEKLAAYFNVTTDYLLGKSDNPHGIPFAGQDDKHFMLFDGQQAQPAPSYYHDPEVAQMANEIKDNPDMRILFDASRDLKKESIEEVVKFIEFQKAKERGDWD